MMDQDARNISAMERVRKTLSHHLPDQIDWRDLATDLGYIIKGAERQGIRDAIAFIEGGRFLHDDAPSKRWANEAVAGLRRHFGIEP